ncbi:hypothetical protein T265_01184 [Opisthorchis viverrini]|uniref:WD domain, G-beta repeat protein n=1 Tax=Opisthorchis viverrini TaxID=6198 RepID=A0A075AAS2_OPIVI|nr:hypothetical protein T265_01184 [Opisthorchis viverrini]KER32905.1 hypothetical protein T265_01184 [Opisthorchis viverrini]
MRCRFCSPAGSYIMVGTRETSPIVWDTQSLGIETKADCHSQRLVFAHLYGLSPYLRHFYVWCTLAVDSHTRHTTPLAFERSSSCSGVIVPVSPHQRDALDSSFALIRAYQQLISNGCPGI